VIGEVDFIDETGKHQHENVTNGGILFLDEVFQVGELGKLLGAE